MPNTTPGEQLCNEILKSRSAMLPDVPALTFSLALFKTAELHVSDLLNSSSADRATCNLLSWSINGLVFTPCCMPEPPELLNACSKDKPTQITRNWIALDAVYPGDAVEWVLNLSAADAASVAATAAAVLASEFAVPLRAAGQFATYASIGCELRPPLASVWLGSLKDPLPYKTGGAPPVSDEEANAGALDTNTIVIIGAVVGGVGLLALCAALVFCVVARRKSSASKAPQNNVDKAAAVAAGNFGTLPQMQEAGGQYGSTLQLKSATESDNRIYSPDLINRGSMLSAMDDEFGVYTGMSPNQTQQQQLAPMQIDAARGSLESTRASMPMQVDTYYEW